MTIQTYRFLHRKPQGGELEEVSHFFKIKKTDIVHDTRQYIANYSAVYS